MTIPTIETERMVLRPFRDDDLDAYAAMNAHPEVWRYLSADGPPSREETWRSMAMLCGHWTLRGYGTWAAELKGAGELVGRVGLHHPEGWPGLEVGWTFARPHWGKGLATEGGLASLDYAWDELGVDRVISVIHPDNTRSIAVAERLGMAYERRTSVRGVDVSVYGIDRP